jgi:sentrin-specific protease 1
MFPVHTMLSKAWDLAKSFITPILGPPVLYLDMSSVPVNGNIHPSFQYQILIHFQAITDDHIEVAKPTESGATSLKRQKTRRPHNARRSRSAVDYKRNISENRSGIGPTNIEDCINEAEARRKLDLFWLPEEITLPTSSRRTASTTYPTLPTEQPAGDEQNDDRPRQRRHSDTSSDSLRTPISSFSSPGRTYRNVDLRPTANHTRALRTPESQVDDLENKLQDILLDGDELLDPFFRSSKLKAEERQRRREEERARQEAEAARVRKERRLKRQHPVRPLVEPLDPKWEEQVRQIQSIRDPGTVITNGLEGTPLARKDFETLLANRAWLNDEIINAYLEWVVTAANAAAVAEAEKYCEPKSTVPKFIAQNSFFYQSVLGKGPKSTERLMKRKKAPGASFLEVDSMFVPICSGSHWTVGVVRPVTKTIEYFDSMGGANRQFIKLMREWLKVQLGAFYKEEEWTVPQTGCAHQTNGWDCGVFVCTNTFCIAMGLDTSCYYERDMKQQRRNIAAVLKNKGFIGDFAWEKAGLLP